MKSTHNVKAYRNSMDSTAGKAPFLGTYISHENVPIDALCAQVSALCGLTAIQVRAILEGSFEAIGALEREALVRVHTDLGVVCGVIRGSFPTADAAFDASRNSLVLALRLADALRLDLADVVPTIVTDANLTKLRVDNVMDLAEERPMNLIHGRHVFRVAGFNMVLSDEGAAAFLQNGLGVSFPLAIDRVVTHQLFEAHTAELLPAGDYKLVVKSRAGDAEGPLQTSFRRVKYLRVEDPAPHITSGHSESHADDGKCYADGSGFVLEGENLEDAIVTIAGSANEGETWSYEETVPADKVNFENDEMLIDGAWLDSWYNHLEMGELVKVTVTNSDGEDSNTFTLAS